MNAVDDMSARENVKLFQDAREENKNFNELSPYMIHILGLE